MAVQSAAGAGPGPGGAGAQDYLHKLVDSINDTSRVARNTSTTLLLVALYLGMTLLSSTDEQLLREGAVRIPQLDTGIPLKLSYIFAPLIFLFLHVAFLVQMYLLARKLRGFNRALGLYAPQQPPDEFRLLLSPFPFTQILAGEARGRLTRWPLHFLVWATVAVVPVLLLLAVQLSFVRYHSEGITLLHRLVLLLDLGTLAWFVLRYRTMWREQPAFKFKPRPVLVGATLLLPALLLLRVSWWDGRIPGSAYDQDAEVETFTDIFVGSWGCVSKVVEI